MRNIPKDHFFAFSLNSVSLNLQKAQQHTQINLIDAHDPPNPPDVLDAFDATD